MKLQTIKQEEPQQENIQPESLLTHPSKVQNPAYFVLEFKELLDDILVIILIDQSYYLEVKNKFPGASIWSIEALEKFMADDSKRDPDLWKAVNLTKAVFGGRIIK